MSDDAAGGERTLCRHEHMRGGGLSLRYTLSDGTYVGEIEMRAWGGAEMWQTLAYDLLQLMSAAAHGAASAPEPGEAPVMRGVA